MEKSDDQETWREVTVYRMLWPMHGRKGKNNNRNNNNHNEE